MANFDLSALALKSVCPNNEILCDNVGLPSVMVRIPKKTYADLGIGTSTATHPAFIINGTEVDEIYIGKYQSCVQNGRAYSLPGVGPATGSGIDLDGSIAKCSAKGDGWHLMTLAEHALVLHMCEQAGYIPIGNNNFGKHSSETIYTGIPFDFESDGRTRKILTGTGPLTYYTDNDRSGISDLCGNVWEWAGGVRSVYGELQVLVNNNAADADNPQTAAATTWKAINASDGTFITPNGSGTTSGSVKMDWVSSKLTYDTTISDSAPGSHNCEFKNIAFSANISSAAQNLLIALRMAPKTGTIVTTSNNCYFNNGEAERAFFLGGYYGNTTYGLASFDGRNARSLTNVNLGFRLAYAKLPAA